MPRNWYVSPRPRFDVVETFKSGFIFVIGTIYVALIGGVIIGGIYLYAISKGVT